MENYFNKKNMQDNNYIDVELDEDEIQNLIAQGYMVEELPKAQEGYINFTPYSNRGDMPGVETFGSKNPTMNIGYTRDITGRLVKNQGFEKAIGNITAKLPYSNNTGVGIQGGLKLVGDRIKAIQDVTKANVETDFIAGYDPKLGFHSSLIASPQFTFGNVQPTMSKVYGTGLKSGEWLAKAGPYAGVSAIPGRDLKEERFSIPAGVKANVDFGLGRRGIKAGLSGYFGVDAFGQAGSNATNATDAGQTQGRTHYGLEAGLKIPLNLPVNWAKKLIAEKEKEDDYYTPRLQQGGVNNNYIDIDADDDEIQAYKDGGYIVEELSKYQLAGAVQNDSGYRTSTEALQGLIKQRDSDLSYAKTPAHKAEVNKRYDKLIADATFMQNVAYKNASTAGTKQVKNIINTSNEVAKIKADKLAKEKAEAEYYAAELAKNKGKVPDSKYAYIDEHAAPVADNTRVDPSYFPFSHQQAIFASQAQKEEERRLEDSYRKGLASAKSAQDKGFKNTFDYVYNPKGQQADMAQREAGIMGYDSKGKPMFWSKALEEEYNYEHNPWQFKPAPQMHSGAAGSADWFWTLPLAIPAALEGIGSLAAMEIPGMFGATLGDAVNSGFIAHGLNSLPNTSKSWYDAYKEGKGDYRGALENTMWNAVDFAGLIGEGAGLKSVAQDVKQARKSLLNVDDGYTFASKLNKFNRENYTGPQYYTEQPLQKFFPSSSFNNLESQIAQLKQQEILAEESRKALYADYRAGQITAEEYATGAKQLNPNELLESRNILEKELRDYNVKQDIANTPQQNILKFEEQLGKDISDGGSNTKGVFELGDNYVARLSAHGYDDASRLINYADKIKSPRIAKTLQVKELNGKVYQVQEKVTGIPITKLSETELQNIPKEHIDNFWKDKAELDELGLSIDISGGKSNIFYDSEKGFQIIDLGIGTNATNEVIVETYKGLKLPSSSNVVSSVDDVVKQPWQLKNLPGLHLKSTMFEGPISKIIESKTGLINVEQALGIIGKESSGADKVALIKEGLGENIPKKMDYNEFRKIVQDQLIPLETNINLDANSSYGLSSLGYNKYESKELINGEWTDIAIDFPIENKTLTFSNKTKFGRGSYTHNNPDETLGHVHFFRDAETPDALTITQIQSDAFQGTHRRMPKGKLTKTDEPIEFDYQGNLLDNDYIDEVGRYFDAATGENITQKSLLDKNHQERYIQEIVDYASKRDDINRIRLPTSETAAKIQGYETKKTWNITDLKEGDDIVLNDGTVGKVTNDTFINSISVTLSDGKKISVDMSDAGYGTSKNSPIKSINNVDLKEISLFSSEHTTILKKYSEQPKIIKKLYGVEPKIITDSKGNTWYEFNIPYEFKEGISEIKAFKHGGNVNKLLKFIK